MQHMKIGLFGGTFDPIHCAHLRIALAFQNELQLDEVRLIPAGMPYHRAISPVASPQQRLDMVKLAIANYPDLVADDREVRRQHSAYTVETLQEIRQEKGDKMPLWFLMGADAFMLMNTWWHWENMLSLANLAIAARPGFDPRQLPDELAGIWQKGQGKSCESPFGCLQYLNLPPVDLSASALRDKLSKGEVSDQVISVSVLAYIQQNHLYLAS